MPHASGPAERIAEDIRAAVETDGPQSAALIGPLSELAVLYEAEGKHALATAALEEARHVVRANYGLHTLDQAPLIQQALENQQALGNFEMVKALEEELLDLANRHPDDLRTVEVHRNVGARRMNLLGRFLGEEYSAEIYGSAGLFLFARDDVVAQLVAEGQLQRSGRTRFRRQYRIDTSTWLSKSRGSARADASRSSPLRPTSRTPRKTTS